MHDYVPDFIVKLSDEESSHLILEIKGYDPLEEIKRAAAERWISAVNSDGRYGSWIYRLVKKVSDVPRALQTSS